MTETPLVGIVGAAGAVGREAARLLAREPGIRLRLGSRQLEPLRDLAAALTCDDLELVALDLYDPTALSTFCAGCRIVVSCAAPSFRILDLVARAAFAAGADYVDPGGDHPLHVALSANPPPKGRTALLTAGMMPGLSALLPRWLARRELDRVERLTAYVGGRGRMTAGTAGDYVLSVNDGSGEANAAIRGGVRVSRELATIADVELPFFSGRVTAQPFIGAETTRIAAALGLREVDWYNVFDGAHMLAALRRVTQRSSRAVAEVRPGSDQGPTQVRPPSGDGRVGAQDIGLPSDAARTRASIGDSAATQTTPFVSSSDTTRSDRGPTSVRPQREADEGFTSLVAELAAAAELDMFGKSTYQTIVITLEGTRDGSAVVRTVVLRGTDAHALTATVTACAALELMSGLIGEGVFYGGEALPIGVMDRIARMPAVTSIETLSDVNMAETAVEEEAL